MSRRVQPIEEDLKSGERALFSLFDYGVETLVVCKRLLDAVTDEAASCCTARCLV